MKALAPVLLASFVCLPVAVQAQTPAPQRDSVLAVVQTFFDAMAAHDTATWSRVLTPEGRWYGYSDDGERFSMFTRTNREGITGLATSPDTILERMWEPTVLVHDRMAVVWTPYDLYIDGEFSHCGIDAFTLVKTDDGWRIASIVFSREPEGCPPSPLGAPSPLGEPSGQ